MMERLSLRAWLAVLLVISGAVFFVGIYLERGVSTPTSPVAVQPSPSAHVEGAGGEAGEAGDSEAPGATAPIASAGQAGESTAEHAAETWPFGIDLEAPLLVGGAILVSLMLAFAVLRATTLLVPIAIIGFSMLFAILDLVELSHQLGAARTGLAVIAAVLLILHATTGLIAARLLMTERSVIATG